MTHHPWRFLRGLPHVTLEWVRMHGRVGETNGVDLIRIHPDQLQVERRVTLTHETVHLERGHTTGCAPAVESEVREEASRRLIELPALLDALAWTEDWDEAADELWVTVDVLRDRIDTLSEVERAALVRRARELDEATH
ncbi:ImmA/IrrE family metallo-endopeptidase [Litorihabitans aurantiacus]|uniref:IrrE N-terminal-like domain-containing protein n=1 Tax=Litorihabitans aurantiacus TaxID=1930061 RepID=A0AA37XEB1_9MICO|nr:ImmA/IrrE family metallo-endopeptidase [Litorihabitans aurantiacus]GMA31565.1 hypothetical protein GCM10025875_15570 [Litorihabitans aurantiacus]